MATNPARKKSTGETGNPGECGTHRRTDATIELTAVPRRSGTLGGYEVKNYRTYPIGREGGAFSATIYRDRKRVLKVENHGDGGQNWYTGPDGRPESTEYDLLFAKAKQAYGEDGAHDPDMFVDLIKFNADIDKHASKIGVDRTALVEATINANAEHRGYTASWHDSEAEVLRHPESLD